MSLRTSNLAVVARDDAAAPFCNDFVANAADLPGAGLEWLASRRRQAMDAFAKAGMPHRRVEAWKYTDIASALGHKLEPATPLRVPLVRKGALADPFGKIAGPRLTLVNGYLAPSSSMPDGIEVVDLGSLSNRTPGWVAEHLGRAAAGEESPLGALSLGLMRGGVAVRVTNQIELPLHLSFLTPDREQGLAAHARVLLILENGASLTLVESHLGEGGSQTLSNLGVEIVLSERARLDHVRLHSEGEAALHVTSADVTLAPNSHYAALFSALGGELARLDMAVHLLGDGAEADLHGLMALGDDAHSDITTLMDHAVPRTKSRQVFKSVLGGRARSVMQGRVTVRQGAMKSDSHQLFKALLLGERAEADAKPELEILADDVICGHGAAVGQLDQESLFYLRARGIPELEARALLVRAFLEDVTGGTGEQIHDALWRKLDAVLPAIAGESS
ncbi:MAG: Fe-S cluster assembly protein SufD [Alphaproteobacteria bacterium]